MSCAKEDDSAAIKRIVREAAAAVSKNDVKGVTRHVSKDYRDERGNDYNALKGFLLAKMLRGDSMKVSIISETVEVKGDKAVYSATVIFTGTGGGPVLGGVDKTSLSVVFDKKDGEWKALTAAWQ
ncbi:MAG: hypothetical protein OEV59_09065 [Deltaproteobacteria bacterium]|nr:hypothetical protein [Deltaproteobacteria bacterium]